MVRQNTNKSAHKQKVLTSKRERMGRALGAPAGGMGMGAHGGVGGASRLLESSQVKSSFYSPHKYKIAPLKCLVRVVCAAGNIESPWCKVVRAAGEIARCAHVSI